MKAILGTILYLFTSMTSIYDLKMNSLEGTPVDFASFKGRNLLIVNVASKCGMTPQYKDLQSLHEQFGSKVTVLGFPANNFGSQEPGTNLEIGEFCEKNYGVTFQMFEKLSVKGADQHELYKWLKEKTGHEPTWNFSKYLVKADGTVKFFAPDVKPLDAQILSEIN
ncbi:MAG: glutathione peroxidase [Chryseolinea sp.]